jgi:hypothetical protein
VLSIALFSAGNRLAPTPPVGALRPICLKYRSSVRSAVDPGFDGSKTVSLRVIYIEHD